MAADLLRIEGIAKRFVKPLDFAARIANKLGASNRETVVHAVDGVDLTVAEGEVVALVGESAVASPPSVGSLPAFTRPRKVMSTGGARISQRCHPPRGRNSPSACR